MKGKIKTISLAVCFAIVAFVALVYINSRVIGRNDSVETVVAMKNIAHNTEITKQNINDYFKIEKVSSDLVTDKTLKSLDGLVGKYVSSDIIYEKALVNSQMFSSKKDIVENFNNPVRMSFSVGSFSDAVCGRIRSGDIVDIYCVSSLKSQNILKNAYVENVYDSSGIKIENWNSTTSATAFTVIIEGGEENKLLEMIKNSKVVLTKVK
jgi:hypothetical protein